MRADGEERGEAYYQLYQIGSVEASGFCKVRKVWKYGDIGLLFIKGLTRGSCLK